MVSLTFIHNGHEERYQFGDAEIIQRLYYDDESLRWYIGRYRAQQVMRGDWIAIGDDDEDAQWCRVILVTETMYEGRKRRKRGKRKLPNEHL